MGWGSVLGMIGAVGATIATGGAAAPLIPLAGSIGQAVDSANAEKKAAKQQQEGYGKVSDLYSPYAAVGGQATNALAQGFGLPGVNFGGALPPAAMTGRTAGTNPIVGAAVPRVVLGKSPTPVVQEPSMSGGRLVDLAKAAKRRSTSSYAKQEES